MDNGILRLNIDARIDQIDRLHDQTEIDQTKVSDLEDSLAILRKLSKELLNAIEQESFFGDGYINGSATISELVSAGDKKEKAYSDLWNLLNA